MNIGFDAKRAFHNHTGLGHYSRTLIRSLADYYPEHEYFLFNPKPADLFRLDAKNLHEVLPTGLMNRVLSSAWRSSWVKKDLLQLSIQLYHGLSHEIPVGIQQTGIPSVVTIHDLIHERYPDQYSRIDIKIYHKKFLYACENADRVIAISEQTKNDIITYYGIAPEKIRVCYQSCNPAFARVVGDDEKKNVKAVYGLPDKFFLTVGSIIERKNLLSICKAIFLLRYELDIPLVVIGDGGKYKQQVQDYIRQNGLQQKIIFLSDNPAAKANKSFQTAADFPAIYQSATAMIYPSFFEGFGIPVLESLWSRLPVITSNISCLPEAGGPAAHYIDPHHADEIAFAMKKIATDPAYSNEMRAKGWEYAQQFTQQKGADAVMAVYREVVAGS